MADNVNEAFKEFLQHHVNLDREKTSTARSSRDWLVARIDEFPLKDSSFPALHSTRDIFFGSFERRTKKRPLDDIDMMVCIAANGATYEESIFENAIFLTIHDNSSNLRSLCFDDSSRLSSRKVINRFVSKLSQVPQYRSAEINRNGEAATVKLLSYDWNFDIVPCFFTQQDQSGKDFYLIPDGSGNWKKTDPRIDRDRVKRLVDARGTKILTVIRLVKFWNGRPTMPSMPSYLLENMILDFYETQEASDFPDISFRAILDYMKSKVYQPIHDPKGIQGDLNTLSFEDRYKISGRCERDYAKTLEAWNMEKAKDYRGAINKWREVFGDCFPGFY